MGLAGGEESYGTNLKFIVSVCNINSWKRVGNLEWHLPLIMCVYPALSVLYHANISLEKFGLWNNIQKTSQKPRNIKWVLL